jgi:hypothetical protein
VQHKTGANKAGINNLSVMFASWIVIEKYDSVGDTTAVYGAPAPATVKIPLLERKIMSKEGAVMKASLDSVSVQRYLPEQSVEVSKVKAALSNQAPKIPKRGKCRHVSPTVGMN